MGKGIITQNSLIFMTMAVKILESTSHSFFFLYLECFFLSLLNRHLFINSYSYQYHEHFRDFPKCSLLMLLCYLLYLYIKNHIHLAWNIPVCLYLGVVAVIVVLVSFAQIKDCKPKQKFTICY